MTTSLSTAKVNKLKLVTHSPEIMCTKLHTINTHTILKYNQL